MRKHHLTAGDGSNVQHCEARARRINRGLQRTARIDIVAETCSQPAPKLINSFDHASRAAAPISQGRPSCGIRDEVFEPRVDRRLIGYSGQQHQRARIILNSQHHPERAAQPDDPRRNKIAKPGQSMAPVILRRRDPGRRINILFPAAIQPCVLQGDRRPTGTASGADRENCGQRLLR
jgi:hypothetical protein